MTFFLIRFALRLVVQLVAKLIAGLDAKEVIAYFSTAEQAYDKSGWAGSSEAAAWNEFVTKFSETGYYRDLPEEYKDVLDLLERVVQIYLRYFR